MKERVYTAKDVERCFPWITAWTTNHRVKAGALRIAYPSTGTGIPNVLRFPELVHAGVVDELASLGVFGVQHSTTIHYREPRRDEKGEKQIRTWTGHATDAYFVDYDFYERHDYRVVIEVQIRHDFLPGANVPREHREGPGRFYVVTYSPEIFEGEGFIEERLEYWRSPKKAQFNRLHAAKAFIRVRQLYELAADVLRDQG